MERELKYLVENPNIVKILELFTKNGFTIMDAYTVVNDDEYYDTNTKDLLRLGKELRLRDKKIISFKETLNEESIYKDRLEINTSIDNIKDIPYNVSKICPFPILNVNAKRYKVIVKKGSNELEISFDTIKYYNNHNDSYCEEELLEIEALNNTEPKVLIEIDSFINSLGLTRIKMSKYERGMILTNTKNLTRQLKND